MTSDTNKPSAVPARHRRPFPPIRVVPGGEGGVVPMVHPAVAGPPPFEPFGLPAVPRSLADWLATLHATFRRRHARCLGSLLLLDPKAKSWSTALPPQRCARDAATWSGSPDDFPGLPEGLLLAGTFQSRVLAPGESAVDAVPPAAPGVHLVQVLHADGCQHVWTFLNADGVGVTPVAPDQAIDDDWACTLRRARARLALV